MRICCLCSLQQQTPPRSSRTHLVVLAETPEQTIEAVTAGIERVLELPMS
jgi:hypothetical protein